MRSGPSALIIILCAICLIALVLPTVGEISSMPFYLHLTINQKLIAAYILGISLMSFGSFHITLFVNEVTHIL